MMIILARTGIYKDQRLTRRMLHIRQGCCCIAVIIGESLEPETGTQSSGGRCRFHSRFWFALIIKVARMKTYIGVVR